MTIPCCMSWLSLTACHDYPLLHVMNDYYSLFPAMDHTKETAKVVATVLGTEFIKICAALAILHQDDMNKRMNFTRMKWRRGWIILFFKVSWSMHAARNLINSVPPNNSNDFCLLFCINPYSIPSCQLSVPDADYWTRKNKNEYYGDWNWK